MFRWTDDMVRFMRDAAGFGSYQTELAGWICSQIPQARHVCDAGCGLGYLSLALAPHVRHVTAAEYRAAAEYMENCGITDGYTQERTSAKEEYTPDFDLRGL